MAQFEHLRPSSTTGMMKLAPVTAVIAVMVRLASDTQVSDTDETEAPEPGAHIGRR